MKKAMELLVIIVLLFLLRGVAFSEDIISAASRGDMAAIKSLLAKNPKLVNLQDEWGKTPLIQSVFSGNKKITEYLILKGANVNAKDKDGTSVLQWTVRGGMNQYKEVMKLLIIKGANINAKDKNGRTALMDAAFGRFGGDRNDVEFLISHGAIVNTKDKNGKTALKIAIDVKRHAIADLLRKHGAK